jgi:VanZ family protein
MRLRSFVTRWMPALAWMMLIFVGSTDVLSAEHTSRFLIPFLHWLDPHMPIATAMTLQTLVRKLGHVTEYAILAALLWRALRSGRSFQTRLALLFSVALFACAVFAASDEFHQSFVPSRTPAVHDVMIDICGAAIGLLICWAFADMSRKTPAIIEASW